MPAMRQYAAEFAAAEDMASRCAAGARGGDGRARIDAAGVTTF